MYSLSDFNLSPDLILGRSEHARLLLLALAKVQQGSWGADWLLSELERADVVADVAVPSDVVRMGSAVRYRVVDGEERSVQLVFPNDADISQSRISILTPVGAALIGMRQGQSISYQTRDGRRSALTVLEVLGSPQDDPPQPAAA